MKLADAVERIRVPLKALVRQLEAAGLAYVTPWGPFHFELWHALRCLEDARARAEIYSLELDLPESPATPNLSELERAVVKAAIRWNQGVSEIEGTALLDAVDDLLAVRMGRDNG